jgi:hypothetical protein
VTAQLISSLTTVALPVVRLQVQIAPMKPGRAPWRVYDPSCLREVEQLRLTSCGVVGLLPDGTELLDVHHTGHPLSRDRRGLAGVSVMATGDYVALRARYGAHLVDGVAGDGVLVDYSPGLARRPMPEEAWLRRRRDARALGMPAAADDASGADDRPELRLHSLQVADPCVEFTRFCLRLPASDVVGSDVTAGLADLGGGARGYKMVAGSEWVVRRGDVLLIPPGDRGAALLDG